MPALILPRQFYSQPQGGANIDWTDPISSGLCFHWAADSDGERISGILPTTNNATFKAGYPGLIADCSSGQINIEWSRQFCTTSTGDGLGDFTMLVMANPIATASLQHVLAQKNDAVGPYAQAGLYANSNSSFGASSGGFAFLSYNNNTTAGVAATSQCDGGWHVWVGRRQGSEHTLWRDGRLQATNSTSPVSILQAEERYTAIGSRGNGSSESYADDVAAAMMFDRALSDDEIAELSDLPWQTRLASPMRLYFDVVPTSAPTLSLPGVTGVTSSGATPYCTLTF